MSERAKEMKKQLITIITIVGLMATLLVPSYGDTWDPGGGNIPGKASLFLAQEDGSLAAGSQINNSGDLSNGYLYIQTRVYITGENGQLHNGKETIELIGYNGSTLSNVASLEMKSGDSWVDVTNTLLNNEREFTQKDHLQITYRLKITGNVQMSLQYKVLTYDTPAQYYESDMKYAQIFDGSYYFTKYEENVSTAVETSEEETSTEVESTTEEESTSVAPTTVEPTTTVAPTTVAPTTKDIPTVVPTSVAPTGDVTTTVAGGQTVKAPGKATIKKIWKKKRSAKKLKVKLKAVKGAKGYQISVYKSKKNAKKHVKALVTKYTKKVKYTIKSKKLKKKKKLFVSARAYNLANNGTKVFGPWSKIKKVKVK